MPAIEAAGRIRQDHSEMRARLADWELGLEQLTALSFSEAQRGLERLWKLVPFFEKEVARHFREEEAEWAAVVEDRHPDRRPALLRFAREHADFLRQWQAYKVELLYCEAAGPNRRMTELGQSLVRLLRQHMESEEQELLPLLESS